MTDQMQTRASLLLKLRDPDDEQAWSDFVTLYAPLIHAYLRKRGVQDADAADLTQEVLQTVSQQAHAFDYDSAKGKFRGWLFTITLNKLRDFSQRRKRQASASGKTEVVELLHDLPEREAEDLWDKEYQWRLFHWAADRARPDFRGNTWDAFWKTAVEDLPVKAVAEELGMSVGAVYIAKSRGLSRIRQIIEEVADE